MTSRGLFITIEGPDGAGKSTHARLLASQLRAAGRDVLLTRDPGGTALGRTLGRLLRNSRRLSAESELFLFLASRAQLVHEVIQPALARGACVVCDRFADSTTAYQGYGRRMDRRRLLAMNRMAMAGTVPDLTLLLDLDARVGLARARSRGRCLDRIERETLAFHERVRAGFLALARRWPRRILVIDADRPPAAVQADLWECVRHACAR